MNNVLYTVLYSFMHSKLGLHGAAKEVFAVIYGFWRAKGAPVTVTNSVIQAITGLSRATIISAKTHLIKQGLVSIKENRGKPSFYRVHLPLNLSEKLTGQSTEQHSTENQTGSIAGPKNKKRISNKTKKRNENQSIIVGDRDEFNLADQI